MSEHGESRLLYALAVNISQGLFDMAEVNLLSSFGLQPGM